MQDRDGRHAARRYGPRRAIATSAIDAPAAGGYRGPVPETPDRWIATLAARIAELKRDLAAEDVDPDVGLLDGGYLDSIALADLLAILEVEYGVVIEGERLLGDLYTLRALASWVAAERSAAGE